MSIQFDEWKTEMDKFARDNREGNRMFKPIPPEVDEIIKYFRSLNPPLGVTKIAKFLHQKGYKIGHTVILRRVKELNLPTP